MLRILIFLTVLVAGLMFGPEISQYKGYILISFDQYTTYETTIINALFISALFYFSLLIIEWIIRRLLSMNSVTKRWLLNRKVKKGQKNSIDGMLALMEGNSKKAENLLTKSIQNTELPILNMIGAAQAAHQNENYPLRDKHLKNAIKIEKNSEIPISIVWSQLLVDSKSYKQAFDLLQGLIAKSPKNRLINKLLLEIYPPLEKWRDLIELVNKKHKILDLSPTELEAIKLNAYTSLFKKMALYKTEDLELFWKNDVPSELKKSSPYQNAYLNTLIEADLGISAEKFLLENLNKKMTPELLSFIKKVKISDNSPLLTLLEKQIKKAPKDPSINRALSIIKEKEGQTAEAIEHLKISIEVDPNPQDCAHLANLLEKNGVHDEAKIYYKKGLINSL